MLVYRTCRREEVEYILKNSNFNIVSSYSHNYYGNTHRYQDGVSYMHFFSDISSIFYMKTNRGRCICIYDIPTDILEKYKGIGIYTDYICFRHEEHVREYAIDIGEMRVEYLKRADVLLQDIDYEDMIDGSLDSSLIENIYNSSKPFIRERKKEEISS
ncbi:MAG: hypothetical protein NC483_02895 [Ruminococcus sp.]|nr:hypothetical protein [Ruminococcus sp.]